jgi:stearoyl-CoA desaturase (delta-9 desaturase)
MSLIASYKYTPSKWSIRRMIKDNFHVFLHEYYFGILMAWIAFWAIIDPILMMHVVIIPAVISVWISTTSNFMNHKWGYINFPTTDRSRNLWINAIFTFGEGWHNNHHARPGNYDFGSGTSGKWWEIDLGAKVINLIRIK